MSEPNRGDPDARNVTPGDWRSREAPRRRVDNGAVVWGLILIVVGGWFFLDRTLGWDMPDLDWDALWPLALILIGGAVILQGLGRRRT
jgi:hypothetical protein